ncbi:MAG: patatin, partial [Gemmatimonadales bacterium]
VRLDDQWHGDGGIRMAAPLAPAVHLGARRIVTVSTRFRPSAGMAPRGAPYPPPAQILGQLSNAVFLDAVDQDAEQLTRINALVKDLPPDRRGALREIELLVVRPSVDLGMLARPHEAQLPRWFRFMTRGLGTREARGRDFLSLLMFRSSYIREVIAIGEADARKHAGTLEKLLLEG